MKEESIQIQVCTYLKWQYPEVLFVCDFAAGIKLNMGQAVKASKMRSCKGLPDIMIFKPRREHLGLFIELKNKTPFKKNRELKKDAHLEQQQSVIDRLNSEGYFATFSTGFDETKRLIDYYMS